MPKRTDSGRAVRTVLFTDIVDSTPIVAEIGDKKWQKLIDRHDALVRAEIRRHKGEEIEGTGDGFLATFEVPERGIKCALEVVDRAKNLGIDIRAGLHTGECELRKGNPQGLTIHIAARVAARAGAGEVLVSNTVKELAVGSGIKFSDQGIHALKGVPGKWNLYSIKGAPSAKPRGRIAPKPDTSGTRRGREPSVMIVDDHPLWRETLRKVIEAVGRVVAEASNAEEALDLAVARRPDIVVMDMNLPSMSGIEATRITRQQLPDARILVLSSDQEKETVLEAVRAGASGYLIKTATADEITEAITKIHKGELAFPPALASFVLDELRGESRQSKASLPIAIATESILDREGLANVLTDCGFEVVRRVSDVSDLERDPSLDDRVVIVVDIGSGLKAEGAEAISRIRRSRPNTAVLVLADQIDASHAVTIMSGEGKGAGYLLRHRLSNLDDLSKAIRRIAAGESVIDPDVVAELVAAPKKKSPLDQLSDREREVLALMAEGRSNQAISEALFLSLKSVEGYVTTIFNKLGLEPTADDHRRVLAVITYLRSA